MRIRAVLEAQQAAWNRGDIDGFMDGYDRAETTTFVSGDDPRGVGKQSSIDTSSATARENRWFNPVLCDSVAASLRTPLKQTAFDFPTLLRLVIDLLRIRTL